MSFSLVDSGIKDGTGTSDTTASGTWAVGDIAFFGMNSTSATGGESCTGGGLTWTKIRDQAYIAGDKVELVAYEATSGTPSAGVLTFSKTNSFTDMGWAVVRPSGHAYSTDNGGGCDACNSYTLTLGTADAWLVYSYVKDVTTFTKDGDSNWVELLDENSGSGGSQQIQYRLSDDTQVLADPGSDPSTIVAVAVGFTSGPTFTGTVSDGADFGDAAAGVRKGRFVSVTRYNDIAPEARIRRLSQRELVEDFDRRLRRAA